VEEGFEYDEAKSQTNKEKHGVSFEEVISLFSDPDMLTIKLHFKDEDRYMNIGCLPCKHRLYLVITTLRGERIRLITARVFHADTLKMLKNKQLISQEIADFLRDRLDNNPCLGN